MKVLGISGSLRKASYNTMALRAAQKLAPEGMTLEIADISGIPMYNDDVKQAGEPAAVAALKAQIRGLSRNEAERLARTALNCATAAEVRALPVAREMAHAA